MIELPEALTLARQMSDTLVGTTISETEANHSPHKFAFFTGDPESYNARLAGRSIEAVQATGGFVELFLSDGMTLHLSEGANPRYVNPDTPLPAKHQLLLTLNNDARLVCTVAMYGCFLITDTSAPEGEYYLAAKGAPSPLSDAFDLEHFMSIVSTAPAKTSAKALLATEQRIPGVGNGVLQDILFNARINPKIKVCTLTQDELEKLFRALKTTLATMAEQGGRNVEKDLYGQPGGYRCILSAKTWQDPCPVCHGHLTKQAYLGGSVYFCPTCQPLP